MVEYAKEYQAIAKTVKDVVCPKCFHELMFPQVMQQQADRYGRELRTYFAWCFKCDIGCEVIQFSKETPIDKRWLIHKYQHYTLLGQANHCLPTGKWTVLNELPEPAAVVTGPGGQYDKQIDPAALEIIAPICLELEKVLKSLTQMVECLLKAIR